eukprot:GDKI01031560.1.p2 GENE.GDKI01031560.1~~GDKI01031560.1.p2  ORF type:complete len:113 (+),score=37.93 GDKI01031560.1:280-618(+)
MWGMYRHLLLLSARLFGVCGLADLSVALSVAAGEIPTVRETLRDRQTTPPPPSILLAVKSSVLLVKYGMKHMHRAMRAFIRRIPDDPEIIHRMICKAATIQSETELHARLQG